MKDQQARDDYFRGMDDCAHDKPREPKQSQDYNTGYTIQEEARSMVKWFTDRGIKA